MQIILSRSPRRCNRPLHSRLLSGHLRSRSN
jgi:hypothetical protein